MKTILFDMYGVIIEESKGNFIPYTYNHFPESDHERIKKLFVQNNLFTKAGIGEISSDEFLTALGYENPQFYIRDYIENHLTVDEEVYTFLESMKDKYKFALLSNDVSDWSMYITEFYKLNEYLSVKIVSADVHCRKPEVKIFEIALEQLGLSPNDCIFIDNNVNNLNTASRIGMDTILFNRDNEDYNGRTVYSFTELYQMLR